MFEKIINAFYNSNTVAIFSHQNSDSDAIGSSIALKLVLESLGKNVQIFIQKPIHSNYEILGVNDNVNVSISKKFDLAVSLDCPEKKRFGIYQKKFESISLSVAIDHHADFCNFADINYLDSEASSTCLILYKIFAEMKIKLTKEVAKCLYAGIATDTGRFMYGNLNKEVFDIVGKLYDVGFDYLTINYNIFQKRTKNQALLYKRAINKMELYFNDSVGIITLLEKDFIETHTTPLDTFSLSDFIQSIDSVKISCLLTQNKEKEFLVSVRSRLYNAQNVAKSFGGGGHIKASGCRIFEKADEAKRQLISVCINEIKKQDNLI